MLDLEELRQLIAFADCGRLSKAAEQLYISQPTLTRTMQRLEEEFGVPLFERTKNSISLNATGWQAVKEARGLVGNAEKAVQEVRAFDRRQRTITVSSAAPAPLWDLLPALSSEFPGMTIASSIKDEPLALRDLEDGDCTLAVLTTPAEGFTSIPFLREKLSISVTPGHALSDRQEVTFSDINGFNFLLARDLGFWDRLCREKMPASRFHVQQNDLAMADLIRDSSLPCFVTDLSLERRGGGIEGRITIPITDREADVTYYLAFSEESGALSASFKRVSRLGR